MINFNLRGLPKLEAFLKSVPRGATKTALEAFTKYILGDSRHGLRHDEPQKYVSRAKAGYTTSPAQIRYFFAVGILQKDGAGGVKLNHYKRTGETAKAWNYKVVGDYKYKLVNAKPGAYWTRGVPGQTRQHKLAGRRDVLKVIADNLAGAIRSARAAVNRFIKQRGG